MADVQVSSTGKTAELRSDSGLQVTVLDSGASLASLKVPTPDGLTDVILSYDNVDDYRGDAYFIGTTVGPFANRIRDAHFELGGEGFDLDANELSTGHCLHGGREGLHRQVFELQAEVASSSIKCYCELVDGHNGFPGNRTITVVYQLLDESSLAIDFHVTTDRDTVVSLANHAYFNLGGPIDDHLVSIRAEEYTPTDDTNCTTGEIRSVEGSVFDLRVPTRIGAAEFDNNFVLPSGEDRLRHAATLHSPVSGLQLDLHTTQPGLQLYTGDYLGPPFVPRQGLCLEAQAIPNAPNHATFPSAQLSAGTTYSQRTIYRLSLVTP